MRRLIAVATMMLLASAAGAQDAQLQVGDMAPEFTLQASDGETYKLVDFRDKQAVAVSYTHLPQPTICSE